LELLTVENVSKAYSKHQALSNVSLTVPRQSIFGLLGPNGAGKTTLIRIITQIINQDSGRIILDGKDITPADVRKIGYLPEERGLYKKMKVGEQLLFLAGLKGLKKPEAKKKIKYWFDRLNVDNWWDKKMEDLSKGMSQKIQFIATVMHDPDLIILDEPFSGFDPVNANLIKENIMEMKNNGTTVIFSTHRMESVEELCDHVAMINKSQKILDGPKHEIKNSFKNNIFSIGMDKEVNLNGSFEVLKHSSLGDNFEYEIQIPETAKPNDLVQELIKQGQLLHFEEKVPTMNEIFIMKVNEGGDQ
jgi:ABC-2 type transport system ATP-binding protein